MRASFVEGLLGKPESNSKAATRHRLNVYWCLVYVRSA